MTPKNQTRDRTMHEQRKEKILHQIPVNHNTNMIMPVDFFLKPGFHMVVNMS